MKILVLLCLCSCAIAGPLKDIELEPQHQSGEGLIIGGVAAVDGQVPWQVSVQRTSHFCGGSIISDQWIITAAHCLVGLTASSLQVRYNTLRSNSGGQLVKISKMISHADYNVGAKYNNDIALLQTATKLTLGTANAKAIPLAAQGSDVSVGSGSFTLSGWGDVREGAQTGTTILQVVTVPIITRANCASLYAGQYTITDNMVCAGVVGTGGKDTCQGDSGGPAVNNGQLVGVVSFGIGCARPNYPGVYARVSNYIPWMKSNGVPL